MVLLLISVVRSSRRLASSRAAVSACGSFNAVVVGSRRTASLYLNWLNRLRFLNFCPLPLQLLVLLFVVYSVDFLLL